MILLPFRFRTNFIGLGFIATYTTHALSAGINFECTNVLQRHKHTFFGTPSLGIFFLIAYLFANKPQQGQLRSKKAEFSYNA